MKNQGETVGFAEETVFLQPKVQWPCSAPVSVQWLQEDPAWHCKLIHVFLYAMKKANGVKY